MYVSVRQNGTVIRAAVKTSRTGHRETLNIRPKKVQFKFERAVAA